MSQDLFAAFGDPPPEPPTMGRPHKPTRESWNVSNEGFVGVQNGGQTPSGEAQVDSAPDGTQDQDDFGDDDWGDFEDASAKQPPAPKDMKVTSPKSSDAMARHALASPPPQVKKEEASSQPDSKIGQHPFAGHMDFLFEPGEDEYDAGEDDLANLAKDPEAAMAFSKRLIAEQEAKAKQAASGQPASSNNKTAVLEQSKTQLDQQHKKLAKRPSIPASQSGAKATPAANPPPARNKLRKKSGYAPTKAPDVLFDAENLSEHDDDDDFGDFENSTSPVVAVVPPSEPVAKQASPTMPSMDLLGLDDNLKPITQIGRSRSDSLRKANEILGPTKTSNHSRTSSLIDDNPWDDFETQPSTEPSVTNTAKPEAEDDAWDDFETAEPVSNALPVVASQTTSVSVPSLHSRATSESALPPTNIPPPAILLSVFPSIFLPAQDALFQPLSRLDHSQRQELLAHPATHQFLRSYLETSLVLARIIAGRKLRWKRDQILSQSMRIGQAGASGKSGMKLTGVDKGEATKEEQEAQEALRLWRAQSGKLRGAVTTASSASAGKASKLPPMPEISDQMPVRTLKAVEGGFTAPHACALCGLKREERVAKVDIDVDDSFGEWWVQGVDMHLACRNWWEEHKAKLKSR
ncbi:hypothetical protein M409DRAFT_60744 [Zasmidium cellare ATCC 36951]|uniref:Uncharacterized protein n=1 Tax=Zasmidium cellare ATCC 36951 TaxID=1080233 RepID=A0A6A6C134_ZASCE|nr:uncharacterized protein M409DRAFT_60744 [Zasmidium cellare ATCC 36951]KAF2159532.1 hypothetical protein M409DRAFT_60744 [Zasmidium cellare ATCC 36951]